MSELGRLINRYLKKKAEVESAKREFFQAKTDIQNWVLLNRDRFPKSAVRDGGEGWQIMVGKRLIMTDEEGRLTVTYEVPGVEDLMQPDANPTKN